MNYLFCRLICDRGTFLKRNSTMMLEELGLWLPAQERQLRNLSKHQTFFANEQRRRPGAASAEAEALRCTGEKRACDSLYRSSKLTLALLAGIRSRLHA